jgi:hypothetical protein
MGAPCFCARLMTLSKSGKVALIGILKHRSTTFSLAALLFTFAGFAALFGIAGRIDGCNGNANVIYLNRDLSTGNLSQWTHRDYGLGTDLGGNESGAGHLYFHSNIAGRKAAGLTVSPTAHASPAANSDSVYLWEPGEAWNHAPYEIWLRTSIMFPSATTISASGAEGEQPYQPTTGEWNWILEFHNDSSPQPACAREFANVALTVKTDDPVASGAPGTKNVRTAVRIMGGNDCAPTIEWVDGPPLQWDHWYEILLHIKWNTKSGIFEWYLDEFSKPYYSSKKIPTLYIRPKGYLSPSYTTLTLANYRLHAPWNSTIYLGPLAVGSTRAAVLRAF